MNAKDEVGSIGDASDLCDLEVAKEQADGTRGGAGTRNGGSQIDFDDIIVGPPPTHVK